MKGWTRLFGNGATIMVNIISNPLYFRIVWGIVACIIGGLFWILAIME